MGNITGRCMSIANEPSSGKQYKYNTGCVWCKSFLGFFAFYFFNRDKTHPNVRI